MSSKGWHEMLTANTHGKFFQKICIHYFHKYAETYLINSSLGKKLTIRTQKLIDQQIFAKL